MSEILGPADYLGDPITNVADYLEAGIRIPVASIAANGFQSSKDAR